MNNKLQGWLIKVQAALVILALSAATGFFAAKWILKVEGTLVNTGTSLRAIAKVKYHKKPVVIEAHKLGEDGWPESIWQGVIDKNILLFMDNVLPYAIILTLEGKMLAYKGDWIIKGVQGEFYPVKPDIFEATYEPVQESEKG